MKVQYELELDISAKAVYRNGKVELTLTGTMPLAQGQNRSVSSTIDKGFSKKTLELFKDAFEAALSEGQDKLVLVTQVNASEALSVAARKGEI